MCPEFQDLWCRPSRGETNTATRGTPYGIRVLCDFCEVKIRDLCTTGIVHENIALAGVSEMAK